jgi:hypothetical protein
VAFRVVVEGRARFFAFALADLAGDFALAVGALAGGDATPEETREECFVR